MLYTQHSRVVQMQRISIITERLHPKREGSEQMMVLFFRTCCSYLHGLRLAHDLVSLIVSSIPVIQLDTLVLTKTVELKPKVLHSLFIAVYSDMAVIHMGLQDFGVRVFNI